MDDAMLLLIYLVGFLSIVGLIGFFIMRANNETEAQATKGGDAKGNEASSTTGDRRKEKEPRKRRGGMDRMRRDRAALDDDDEDGAEGAEEGEEDEGPALSKKEQRKKDKKEMKEEARKEREDAEDNKKTRQSARDQKYAEREREREEMEAQLAAEEAEREKKKEEEAKAELDEWKHLFEVGDDGAEAEVEMAESQGKLAEFVKYIQETKVVEMDEIAVAFEMRTQDAIKRIEDLLMMGRIHGVIDDRGKFICITEDEMKEVAKFMRRRGRVSVMDLAVESNKLIDLTPKRKEIVLEDDEAAAPSEEAGAPQ